MVTNLNRNIEYRFKFFFEKFDNLAKSSHCLEINVEERTNIIIGMHQEDERIEGAKEYRRYVDMGLVILKKIGNRFEFCSATQGNQSKRDIFWEGKLNEGCYLVVPLSTGISMSRPYDFKRINFSLIQNEDLHPYFKSTLKDLFRKINPSISARMKSDEIQSKLDTEAFGAI